MTPAQLLDAIDVALADAKARRVRRRTPVLFLTAPAVLGVIGKAVETADDAPPSYGFTARQARQIRDAIAAAIRADLAALGVQ